MARLGVEVVGVRKDHGVALHGEGLAVTGVDSASRGGHDGAGSLLESHSQSHDASIPGLVADSSLVVFRDVCLTLTAPCGERRDVSHVFVVNSRAFGATSSLPVRFSDVVHLSSSESSSRTPVLDDGTFGFHSESSSLLGLEFGNEKLGSTAHFTIERVSVDGSAQPDGSNMSRVSDDDVSLHTGESVSSTDFNFSTVDSDAHPSDVTSSLSHVEDFDISVVLNLFVGPVHVASTSMSLNSDDVAGGGNFFEVRFHELASTDSSGGPEVVVNGDDSLEFVDNTSGVNESAGHGFLVPGEHDNSHSVLVMLLGSEFFGEDVSSNSQFGEAFGLSVVVVSNHGVSLCGDVEMVGSGFPVASSVEVPLRFFVGSNHSMDLAFVDMHVASPFGVVRFAENNEVSVLDHHGVEVSSVRVSLRSNNKESLHHDVVRSSVGGDVMFVNTDSGVASSPGFSVVSELADIHAESSVGMVGHEGVSLVVTDSDVVSVNRNSFTDVSGFLDADSFLGNSVVSDGPHVVLVLESLGTDSLGVLNLEDTGVVMSSGPHVVSLTDGDIVLNSDVVVGLNHTVDLKSVHADLLELSSTEGLDEVSFHAESFAIGSLLSSHEHVVDNNEVFLHLCSLFDSVNHDTVHVELVLSPFDHLGFHAVGLCHPGGHQVHHPVSVVLSNLEGSHSGKHKDACSVSVADSDNHAVVSNVAGSVFANVECNHSNSVLVGNVHHTDSNSLCSLGLVTANLHFDHVFVSFVLADNAESHLV